LEQSYLICFEQQADLPFTYMKFSLMHVGQLSLNGQVSVFIDFLRGKRKGRLLVRALKKYYAEYLIPSLYDLEY
jgi:hypothetical protein